MRHNTGMDWKEIYAELGKLRNEILDRGWQTPEEREEGRRLVRDLHRCYIGFSVVRWDDAVAVPVEDRIPIC